MRIRFLSRPDWSQIIISGTPGRMSPAGGYLAKWTQGTPDVLAVIGPARTALRCFGDIADNVQAAVACQQPAA
jgi:hypothetical protein